MSTTFPWGVFLFCLGLLAAVICSIILFLLRQLAAMVTRLVPVTAIVREDESLVADIARRVGGPSVPIPFRYEYKVAGRSYRGWQLSLQRNTAGEAAARAALAARQPGDTITVYYDRDHPARAVVSNETPAAPLWVRIGLAAGILALVAGVALVAAG